MAIRNRAALVVILLSFGVLACRTLVGGTAPPPTRALVPGAPGLIAYSSYRDEDWEIYVMNADGSGQVNLTNSSDGELYASWSPDGARIAFTCHYNRASYGICVMNADGSDLTELADFGASPAWVPDGLSILFNGIGNSDDYECCYMMRADGSELGKLSLFTPDDQNPVWSPDGAWLAFTVRYDPGGNQFHNSEFGIYVMRADGSDRVKLASDGILPDWSPGGAQIAFTSFRDGNAEVYTMNPDGSGQTRLTTNKAYDGSPTWSPDGNWIAFMSDRDGNDEIYLMNADGSGQTRLTNNPGG